MAWWKETFGDDYYIELQRHPTNAPGGNRTVYETEKEVNPELIRIANKFGIKMVATNDVHFVNETDAEAHDRLICVSTNSKLTDENRMRYTKQEWMKTQEEMNELFADMPEVLSNTLEILDKVETYSLDHGTSCPPLPSRRTSEPKSNIAKISQSRTYLMNSPAMKTATLSSPGRSGGKNQEAGRIREALPYKT